MTLDPTYTCSFTVLEARVGGWGWRILSRTSQPEAERLERLQPDPSCSCMFA